MPPRVPQKIQTIIRVTFIVSSLLRRSVVSPFYFVTIQPHSDMGPLSTVHIRSEADFGSGFVGPYITNPQKITRRSSARCSLNAQRGFCGRRLFSRLNAPS